MMGLCFWWIRIGLFRVLVLRLFCLFLVCDDGLLHGHWLGVCAHG